MKNFAIVVIICLGSLAQLAIAETSKTDVSLEQKLQELDAGNQAPPMVTKEKLYSVQERYLPLRHKSEVTIGGAMNMTGDDFLRTQQIEAGYRFHFNDRWSLGADYARVTNQFTSAVDNMRTVDGAIPNVPYAISRSDIMVEYHVFYGKFRWTVETVSYFDQYISIGPGTVQMNNGTSGAAVADVGFAFWLSQWGSLRVGVKDYYYKEIYPSGPSASQNLHAHLDFGYLF